MQNGRRTIAKVGRRAVREVRERLPGKRDEGAGPLFPALHWMTAALFAAAGAEAAVRLRGGQSRDLLRISPLVAAPLAGLVHALRAVTAGPRVRLATQLLDGLAAGIAVAGLAGAAYNPGEVGQAGHGAVRRLTAALVPLTFGATACLGLLLERQEDAERREVERLRRRARVVERLVPARKPRLDRIVVHV